MNLSNNKAQMRKGVLEYCTLLILKNEDCYSTDILEKLKSAELIVVEGTLYPLLTRLKNMELLSYRWEESSQGPPRKYYSLTAKGEEALKELDRSWNELVESINTLKKY
ncbi:MAG: PadR family transcriptional regulator [Bacteroidales bacterium]|jgi:PadR family transcriptional regulator PadR|nr:PadR family transcriptional regulator [Bacteroidales bacterium]